MNSLFLFAYDSAIQFYAGAIRVAALFNPKAKLWLSGRKNLLQQIKQTVTPHDNLIWMHCASVGEFEQGRPVIEKLKKENPNCKVLLTFFSPSGYELRKNYSGADYIFYLPLDTRKNAKAFIETINPQLAIFVKYEFWFHHLNELRKKNIPAILISGIFRREQIFFKWYGKSFQSVLKSFKTIFVQDKNSMELLQQFGINNTTLSSDTRFDRVIQVKNEAKQFPEIEKFCVDKKIIVAGSTWQEDEKIIIQAIRNFSHYKFIIAPHEISEAHISNLMNQLGEKAIRYSQLQNAKTEKQFLVIDNVGMLSSLYRYGAIAYVGGGFGNGIHNILEAAVFGIPVLFGPNYKKFKEANDLVAEQYCYTIQNENEFTSKVNQLLSDKNLYEQSVTGCTNYVQSKTGATEQIVQYIK
ncbi:MAG: glycosyltransferase N-terminal domain-containing protein, partial [Bacteroidota bacterium]